jgi:hypothetical protein
MAQQLIINEISTGHAADGANHPHAQLSVGRTPVFYCVFAK